jgi:hypothetical protein
LCKLQIAGCVEFKGIFGVFAAKNIQLASFDAPCVSIAAPRDSIGYTVGAITAVLRDVFGWLFVKKCFVCSAGKVKIDVFIGAGKLRIPKSMLALRASRRFARPPHGH